MILLSIHCVSCDSGWVEARAHIGRWDSFPCIYCDSSAVQIRDHEYPHAAVERQAA